MLTARRRSAKLARHFKGEISSGGGVGAKRKADSKGMIQSRGVTMRMASSNSGADDGDQIIVSSRNKVEHVTLNRPSKFNALNLDMVRQLNPLYKQWADVAAAPRCVLMRGAGGKAFCAGGDVASLRESGLHGGSLGQDFFFEEYQLNQQIATAPKVVQVSVWDGVTMGGGVGLSLHGAVRVATEKTRFAMPETALGLFPDVGGTFALSRLKAGYSVGVYIALTGVHLNAYDALWSGLATHYAPREQIDSLAARLEKSGATELSQVDAILREIGDGVEVPGKSKSVIEPHLGLINKAFSEPTVEGILASLDAEQGSSDWAGEMLTKLRAASPTSLKVTLKAIQLNAAQEVTIGSALQTEYRAAVRMLDPRGDFFEGVRAILVDKDNAPKWKHSDIKQVTELEIDQFFAPLGPESKRGELVFL